MRLSLLILLLLSFSFSINAQQCSGPGRTPATATAICGTLTFFQTTLSNCGSPGTLPNPTSGCGNVVTPNCAWYKFHCYQTGTLGFLITPINNDDYDWELLDVTGRDPNDVYTTELRVSLNLSGVPGPTGCTAAGVLKVNCAGGTNGSQYNQMPVITAGSDYLLMINNYDATSVGYGLTFSGTAVLTNNVAPTISSVQVVGCDATKLKVTFSKDILCSSLVQTPAGSEFSITNGTNVITAIVSDCSNAANSITELTLNLQAPLAAGTHNLVVANGSDLNTLQDVCQVPMLPASIPFTVPAQQALVATNVAFSGCAPNVFDVTFSKPVLCSSIAADGSDFAILPGSPAISSVQYTCTGTQSSTTSVRITLQNPLPFGNYQLQVKTGSDGNTLTDTCGNVLAAGYTFPFVVPQTTVAPVISSVVFDECHPTKLVLNFDKVINCSSISANGNEFSITPGINAISAIATSCGANTYTNQITLTLQNPLAGGNYNVAINSSPTDNTTISDTCFSFIAAGYTKAFTATQAPPLTITQATFSGCAPKVFTVRLTKPVLCSSISTNADEFSILPGNPAIASVQFTCTGGANPYTEEFVITLQDPLPYGNYQLRIGDGTDGNTLTDTCSTSAVNGYTFPIVIPQTTTPPAIQSVVFDECKPFNVKVVFDKPIRCGSLSANGSEFTITPAGYAVTSATGNCAAGYTNEINLVLATKLPSGNFNVNIRNGTADLNTLSDTCFSYMAVGATRAFTTTQAPAPIFDSVQYDKCSPSQIKVFYSKPILCSSVVLSGAQWNITGPVPVTITSVTGNPATCVSTPTPSVPVSYSNWFILQLSAPVNTFGTFILHNATAGGFTLTDTCQATQNAANTISFNVLGRPSATFADQVKFGCVEDTIVLSHPGGNGINTWNWTFSDGTTATGQTVTHTFPVSTVTATAQLVVSNGLCNDTLQRSYTLDNAFQPLFTITPVDTICRNKPLSFVNNSTGNNLQYLWQFGDNTTFAGQTPPAHTYTVSNDYTIRLIVTDNHGCKDTALTQLNVTALPTAAFGVLDSKYCAGDVVTLTGSVTGNISSYTWNNGDGKIFTNTPNVSFSYANENDYFVRLTVNDRFCDPITASASTHIFALPSVALGEDKTLCPGLTTQIGVQPRSGYIYLWNTGATTSLITTGALSGTYTLTADNNGCKGSDVILVNVLDNCLIKVAGAFTPNRDGRNDELKAINADLATNFLLRVYNRFGQLVFSTTNPLEGWDGRQKGQDADSGTYVWQLSYVDPISRKPVYQKGTSVLIR